MEKTVLFEVQDKVALITLNRPERHNAICQDLLVNPYNYVYVSPSVPFNPTLPPIPPIGFTINPSFLISISP